MEKDGTPPEKHGTPPDPSRLSNGVADGALLCGEFTDANNAHVRYSVSLTDTELTVQQIPAVSPDREVFRLTDCIGCRAHRGRGEESGAAYFTAYFYGVKPRWMAGPARQREERGFRVAVDREPLANLAEAERWARAIRGAAIKQIPRRDGAFWEVRRPCRVMLLLNPNSGRGQALQLFTTHVLSMLSEAEIPFRLVITEHQNHARELVKQADLTQWDALVIMSGDGLFFEVVNGLMEREDWERAIQTPLGILPGGSGNALAASVHHYSQSPQAWSEDLLLSCAFLLCKGLVGRLDLVSLHLPSGRRLFSFLSLAWGFVADVDIESERFRHAGGIRFLLGTLARLASLRVYRGRLAYLPAAARDADSSPPRRPSSTPQTQVHPDSDDGGSPDRNSRGATIDSDSDRDPTAVLHPPDSSSSSSSDSPPGRRPHGPPDLLLPGRGRPVPASWTVVEGADFVLVLAIYQSHLAEDLRAAPGARHDDGVIHLLYVRGGVSRAQLLRLFLAMGSGGHLDAGCPHLGYERVAALRLEPDLAAPGGGGGVMTVDGEPVECGAVEAQVHPGLARIITS